GSCAVVIAGCRASPHTYRQTHPLTHTKKGSPANTQRNRKHTHTHTHTHTQTNTHLLVSLSELLLGVLQLCLQLLQLVSGLLQNLLLRDRHRVLYLHLPKQSLHVTLKLLNDAVCLKTHTPKFKHTIP